MGLALVVAGYLTLSATVLAPVDTEGATVTRFTVHSEAVGSDRDVGVIVPRGDTSESRPLLVFLHGRGESIDAYTENEAIFRALAGLRRLAPIVAVPDGGDHGYWHDRAAGDWGRYVLEEVIPEIAQRFGADPRRVAIGGISMGGFGAYDLALLHPGRFCAVGGHSAALWLSGGETAPGAFDDAADFERNDVIAMAQSPGAFAGVPVWNDAGHEDPFLASNTGFASILREAGADLTARVWPGGHDDDYWDRHWDTYLRFYAEALESCA